MKRGIVYTGILALLAGGITSQAQATRLGIHGVFSNAGDVEDSQLGIGGQLELPVNPYMAVELAVTQVGDEIEDNGATLDQDLTSLGLSAVFRGPLGPQLEGYTLLGLNYNTFDVDTMDMDDAVGLHIGAGLNLAVAYNMELFGEYRYTFLDTDWESEISSAEGDYNYDFGVAKLGLNFLF
ncbi:MAG: porin family protein [Candidatus Electrothrix sp. GW3-4]|uniref:porin family protein n=1 Tax=Candidatus Electrothrix sp. GW3-4 TaxID=3126740 RepID=UPI0030D0D50E